MNVQDLLDKKDIRYMPKGRDFLVSCINPEHEDRNPSMRIDQITGVFQCFSCEYKGNLFTHFGEKANQLQLKRELLKKRISEKRADSIGLSFPKSAVPYIGNWRNIKPETYFIPKKQLKPHNVSTKIIDFELNGGGAIRTICFEIKPGVRENSDLNLLYVVVNSPTFWKYLNSN